MWIGVGSGAEWGPPGQQGLNIPKCSVLAIGANGGNEPVYCVGFDQDRQKLQVVSEQRDLGVFMDSGLKFDEHVSRIVASAGKMLGIIKRNLRIWGLIHLFVCTRPWSEVDLSMDSLFGALIGFIKLRNWRRSKGVPPRYCLV